MAVKLEYTYTKLNDFFYQQVAPKYYEDAELEYVNNELVVKYQLDFENQLAVLSGQSEQNSKKTYAQSYAGHQFGYLNILGDGRATMLGEITHNQERYDLQFKGSGATKYSRGGDGKLTLKAAYKELLFSKALKGLNIETTETLSIVKTGEKVYREEKQAGALLVRFAKSHIRIATFYNAYAYGDIDKLKELADYTISRHQLILAKEINKYLQLYKKTVEKQAKLTAEYMANGFIHGVLNTDNVLISGQAIDFGPCAFLDAYIENQVFSSIDTQGRYAYDQQPDITKWNLIRLGEALHQLWDVDDTEAETLIINELDYFDQVYEEIYYAKMQAKIGIESREKVDELIAIMKKYQLNYHHVFRYLTYDLEIDSSFSENDELTKFKTSYQANIELMKKHNPIFILTNNIVKYLIDEENFSDAKIVTQYLENPYNYYKDELFIKLLKLKDLNNYTTYCGT